MDRVDLPNGAWAELRDPRTVSTRLRRPYQRAMRKLPPETLNRLDAINQRRAEAEGAKDEEALRLANLELQGVYAALPEAEIDAIDEASDAASAALVERWSFPQAVSLEAILDLPGHVGDALREAVAPLVAGMFVDTSPDPNRGAPGGGSSDSEAHSAEGQPTTSPMSGATSASSD